MGLLTRGIRCSFREYLLCALTIGTLAVPASATISYYAQDPGGYNTALTSSGLSVTNIDFASFVGPATTGTINDVLFAGFDGTSTPANLTTLSNFGGGWPAGTLLERATGGGSIVITFPTGVRGFAFTFSTVSGSGNSITINTVTSQDSNSYPQNAIFGGAPYFFGAIAPNVGDGTFNSVTLSVVSFSAQIDIGGFSDDMAAAVVSSTPEGSSLMLSGIGGLLLLVALKPLRRRLI